VIGKTTLLRTKIKGIHPNDIIIGCNNGVIKCSKDKDLYDFELLPNRVGKIRFYFFIEINGKMKEIGRDSSLVSK
jgi:hypothetical protein